MKKDNLYLEQLKYIATQLMLDGCFMNNLGLIKGKMGIAIFFFHYSRFSNNIWYEEFAEVLLSEVYQEINEQISIEFSNGLCGIGWAIEYLTKYGFVEGNTDEILSDLDKKVMGININQMNDPSLETGLEGIICYVNSRLSSLRTTNSTSPFDLQYLDELKNNCRRLNIKIEKTNMEETMRKILLDSIQNNNINQACWQAGATIIFQY